MLEDHFTDEEIADMESAYIDYRVDGGREGDD